MKKTMLFLFAAAFMMVLGGFGFAQTPDQTPPPAKPVATTAGPTAPAPSAQAVKPAAARPADSVPLPSKPATAPTPALPTISSIAHPAPGLTLHPAVASPAPPVAAAAMIEAAPGVAVLVEQTPPPKEAAAATAPASRAVPQPEQPGQAQTAPPAKPEKAPMMRTEIIKFNYLDAAMVHSLLYNYRSQSGRVSNIMDRAAKSIVVTDTTEIVEKMISIVREIDVKPAEIQFMIQLVQGVEAEGSGDETLKNDPVIRELRNVLRYKTFTLLDGTLMRVIDGNESETKFGPNGEYVISLVPRYVKDGVSETIHTRIQLRKPEWISQKTTNTEKKEETQSMQMYYNDLIQTTLQLKVGEKTVVGVSKSDSDRGLILILSAKVIK